MGVEKAKGYYIAEVVSKGGTITALISSPEKEIIEATTADGKPYVVHISEKAGETVVTINGDMVQ